jgi:hypothetical protein
MANGLKIVAIALIVFGLIFGGVGAYMMFSLVPGMIDDAEVPDDMDKHFFYGGYLDKLNTGTGAMDHTEFVADRHVTYDGKADDGHIYIRSAITAKDNATSADLPDLASDTVYEVHPKKLTLYNVDIQGGSDEGYTRDIDGSEGVNYVFPIPAEEEDYLIWSSDIYNWTTASYLGKEDRGGVECYVYLGTIGDLDDPEDRGYEVPLPQSLAQLLDAGADYAKFYKKGWIKAWAHPTTGAIIDYTKVLYQYLYLDGLPEIPEIIYPSDLMSTSGFDGTLILFDQATGTFTTLDGITAERILEVVEDDGYVYTANDTTTVYDPLGMKIDLLSSEVQVMFDATDGSHAGMERTGNFLFPPTGVAMDDYMIWDDGFGKELTAEYVGNKSFGDLDAYEYMITVENEPYLSGGVSSMEMSYWVEINTGIVLDVDKHVTNWRPQPARRLPTDTALINKTVHMNATITQSNPIMPGTTAPTDIVVEQMINCTGYTDATFAVAMIEETITKLYNGTPMATPTVSRFGVDAVTMEYSDAGNWTTVDRTGGVFTFPIGLLNETGNVTPSYTMWNSDLGVLMPAMLTEEIDFNGLAAAVYEMSLEDYPLDYTQLVAALSGQDPGIPGATGLYTGSTTYTVDIDTGTILDVERMMTIEIVPPTYEFLWDNLMSSNVLIGEFMGENLTVTQVLTGAEADDGTTEITVTETTKYDNGTDFLPPDESVVVINTTSHEILESGVPTGLYFLFPAAPDAASYMMAQTLGPYTIVDADVRGTEIDTTVAYNWTGDVVADAALIGYPGMNLNVTMWYDYLVDKVTGMVLDASVKINLENNSQMLNLDIYLTSDNDPFTVDLSNKVMGWAISEMPAQVLNVEMSLYDMEVAYNVGKATVTQGLLDVADGDRPALDIHTTMNATTKAAMVMKAEQTLALLGQLEGLQTLHGLNTILGMYDNQIAFVYYTQVEEEPEGYDYEGSVKYHGGEAKDIDDALALIGTTIPIILFVVMIILVLVGIALIVAGPGAGPEAEEEEEEDEEEEPTEEGEEEEGEEGGEEGEGEE